MTTKRRNRSLEGLEFQVDFEDNVSVINVKVVSDETDSFYELEMVDAVTGWPMPQEMFMANPDEDPRKIYTKQDLEESVVEMFELEDVKDFVIEGVSEWENGVDLEDLKPTARKKGILAVESVFEEMQAGIIFDNAIESDGKLYLRFGTVIVEVSPRFIVN